MVVCDNCKRKIGNSESWRGISCDVCEGEFCNKCSTQGICLKHIPTCKSCKTKSTLIEGYATCETLICPKCTFDYEGMGYCAKCVPKCHGCQSKLSDDNTADPAGYDCDVCGETFCESCIVEITCSDTWYLCKKHNTEFVTKNVDNNIIIDYVVQLLKEVKLSPIKICKNLPLPDEDEECSATFKTRKGFISVFFVKADNIRVVIEGRNAWQDTWQGQSGSEITISAYNHKDAVTTLQRKCVKLLRS